jgi:hypothetical protein
MAQPSRAGLANAVAPCALSGAKQTSRLRPPKSENDPNWDIGRAGTKNPRGIVGMRHGRPSQTTRGAAAYRAVHQILEDGAIFKDPFARPVKR